jgi:hypothetical protein
MGIVDEDDEGAGRCRRVRAIVEINMVKWLTAPPLVAN